jgi:hypothetical protein
MAQLNINYDDYVLLLDVAPPFSKECTSAFQSCTSTALDRMCCKTINHLHLWPPRFPGLIPCDFFLSGSIKDCVYIPHLPVSLKEIHDWITHALQTITADMLHWVLDEFDYRVDVCCVTQGAHIDGLWLIHEKLWQLPLMTMYIVPM